MCKPLMGRRPLPADQKKHTKNVFLTEPEVKSLEAKYGTLTEAIRMALPKAI